MADENPEVLSAPSFALDFDLIRNATYHRSEMQFYLLTSVVMTVTALLALCAAVISFWTFLPPHALAFLTTPLSVLVIFDRWTHFDQRRELHCEKMKTYLSWRAEHNANRSNHLSAIAVRKKMEQEWSDTTSQRYVVHFAVDAIAYNDAINQLYPEGKLRRSYSIELLWWERFAAHILPLSRERFSRRRAYLLEPVSHNLAISFFWILLAGCLAALGFLFHSELNSSAHFGLYTLQLLMSVAVFLLIDAGYHRAKSVIYTRLIS